MRCRGCADPSRSDIEIQTIKRTMTEAAHVLLINPEELMLLGLALAPEATRYDAIGQSTKTWQSLTSFFVDAVEDLASSTPIARSDPRQIVLRCPDTLALRGVEAGPSEIRLHLEWCSIERQIVYFLRDPGEEWPPEIANVNVVVDVGPRPPPLSVYAHHLAPRLAPAAVLLCTAEDYSTRFHPHFPRVEKPAPPVPDVAQELWRIPVYRFQCLRALILPEQYHVENECSRDHSEECADTGACKSG